MAVKRYDPKALPTDDELIAETYAEVAEEQATTPAEPSPRDLLESRLSELVDEIAVAAHLGQTDTLARYEAERADVTQELDHLVAAERGRILAEQRAAAAAKAAEDGAYDEARAAAKVRFEALKAEGHGHLAAWAALLPEMLRAGWAAGDNYAHHHAIEQIQRAILGGLDGDQLVMRRIFSGLAAYPTARLRQEVVPNGL